MKIQTVLAVLLPLAAATAQGDTVKLANGTVEEDVTIQEFTIRELKYRKGGSTQTVPGDQVLGVMLGDFRDVYRRGLADGGDPDLLITAAREQLKKDKDLMAQLGFVESARLFYQRGDDGTGNSALEEMVQGVPDGGLVPEMYRLKFESYMGRGDAGGFRNALTVAKKMQTEAVTNAWPTGFAAEADFFIALAEYAQGGEARAFQGKMRDIASRVLGTNPALASRANVQLAHSLRQNGDTEGAARLYSSVLDKDSADQNSRAGAYLGLGLIAMGKGDAANREPYKEALLNFLRVRLETGDSWASLQGEALFNAMLAAEKWQGEDYRRIAGRCRWVLLNEFPDSEWADRARAK